MKILIEEYRYEASLVRKYLHDIDERDVVEGQISVSYVGYYYNHSHEVNDCVFILPKVLIDEKNKVFGEYTPEQIIDFDKVEKIDTKKRKFVYELAVWIYRAIAVFKNNNIDSSIVRHRQVIKVGNGTKRLSNTYLDILLSLIQFNKENQDFFMFILKNIHSGFNKINWSRTISRSSAVVQNGEPIYIDPINKKRQINFDEELLVIYFSILNYISEKYGFSIPINCNYDLIKGKRFEHYIDKFGVVRLRQIKYKYFSDKALQLWELCFDFFDQSHQVKINSSLNEYLLVKNFNIVFEAIIDELIGDKEFPNRLNKKQEDGKVVDHLFMWNSLTNSDVSKKVYYIGDSKYYKIGHEIGKESVAKQFTYAKNVIQWNLNLFLDKEEKPSIDDYKLQDELTEGYNIIPNFFISAKINEDLSYSDSIDRTDRSQQTFPQRHFNNRLFDRDTLLISHYDVNFLYVVSLYARNNASQKLSWKNKVRNLFRDEIQKTLSEMYEFYAMTPREGVIADTYIEQHFRQLIGKIYAPYDNLGPQKYFSLALDNNSEFKIENASLLAQLEKSFYIKPCRLGSDPRELLPQVEPIEATMSVSPEFLTMHYLEKYLDKSILIGGYKGEKHLDWILGKNDKGTLIYNIRLGKDVKGGQVKARLDKMVVSFVVLYEYGHESENKYRVFRVHHHASMDKKRLIKSQYPSEPNSEKYFCYVFDEEVTLGDLDIHALLSSKRIVEKIEDNGAPIFVSGKELLEYRR